MIIVDLHLTVGLHHVIKKNFKCSASRPLGLLVNKNNSKCLDVIVVPPVSS